MGQPEPRPNSNDIPPHNDGYGSEKDFGSDRDRTSDQDWETNDQPIRKPPSSPPPVGNKFNKTFDPSRVAVNNGGFRLKLINKEGETVERELDFAGETVELNRENVDPDNFSITGKVQAIIECIDGDWYLVDKSNLKTTYVQAQSPFKLSSGDIILLGDRKIIFEE